MTTSASPKVPTAARYDGLDAVRAGAMLLGVCYHAAYAYLPDVGRWYFVADASSSSAFVTVVGVLHSFRMQLFFALAGFFAHLVWERRGPRGFVVDRARRLVVPFACALPVVLAAELALRRASLAAGLMAPDFAPQADFHWAPAHLWFLEYLFLYCLAAAVLARRPPSPLGERGRGEGLRGLSRALAWALKAPESLLVLSIPLGFAFQRFGDLQPALSFLPQPWALVHYGLFFGFGWLLWRARDEVEVLRRRGWWLAVAGLALAWYVFSRPLQWQPAGQFLAGVVPVALTLGGLGLAFRVPQANRPTLRFLVESSYWVYLVHFPVVLALQLAFARLPAPAVLKYLAVVLLTFALALVSFRALVRSSALGPWLGVKSAT